MYFESILPTTFFAPSPKHDILNCPVYEQFEGLKELYNDVLHNNHHNLYLFYNFWTGFLYALSRSNIIELLSFTWANKLMYSKYRIERIVTAFIWAYFFKFLYKYLMIPSDQNSHTIQIPLIDKIISILWDRDYLQSNKKQKIIEDVLSEMIESERGELRDFLQMVLEIIRHSTSLDKVIDLIK